jgi:pSer/pThr/pTyr-binding forkhead associated (FHA) protein
MKGRELGTLIGRSGVPGLGVVEVISTRTLLGRDPKCDLVLPGLTVAGIHAELQLRDGVWWLSDMSGDEGTWVDGERVVGTAPLAPGSTLRFGQATLVFSPRDEWEEPGAPERILPEGRMTVAWPMEDEAAAPEFGWPEAKSNFRWVWYAAGILLLSLVVFYVAHFLIRNG